MKFTKKKVVAGASAALLAGAGVAVAAVVLTSNYTGAATAQTNVKNARDAITDVTVVGSDGVTCTVQNVTSEGFRMDAKATETVVKGEDGATEQLEPMAGSCDVQMKIKNTGDVPLEVANAKLTEQPGGWSVTNLHGTGDNVTFQPGETVTVVGTLAANESAQSGSLKGKVTTQTKN